MSGKIDPEMDGVHWVATSNEQAFQPCDFESKESYDLAVVGGGYAGLSVALEAATSGLRVILFEAGTIGCGASGRNGGIIVPHFPGAITPTSVEDLLGTDRARILIELVKMGPDFVFERIRSLGIRCDAHQVGWVQPAHTESALERVQSVYQDWKRRGAEAAWLDRGGIHERLGDADYLGGWFAPKGGTVNPWALAQGLANEAERAGTSILTNSPVIDIAEDGAGKIIQSGDDSFRAQKVVITTNGYTPNLAAGLVNSVIPVRLFHVLTRPLLEGERRGVLPLSTPFTDLRKSGGFCRFDAENRIMSGGAVFSMSRPRRYGEMHATRRMAEIYPQLAGIEIEHYWEGWCGLRESFLPVIQNHGNEVYSLIGFSTRGIALSQSLGREVGRFLSECIDEADLPIPLTSVQNIPFRAAKQFFGGWAFPVYRLRDRLGV